MSEVGPNPRGVFAARFAELLALAGLPFDRVASKAMRHRKAGETWLVTGNRISAWKQGENVPQDKAALEAVIRALIMEVRGTADPRELTPGLLDESAWRRWWNAARRVQAVPEENAASHPWLLTVSGSALWPEGLTPAEQDLKFSTLTIVERLAELYERSNSELPADPWWDEHLVDRIADRIAGLATRVTAGGKTSSRELIRLSPAEAAHLLLFPYLHVACTRWQARDALQGHNALGTLAQLAPYDVLRRRARSPKTDQDDSLAIERWLFHQRLMVAGLQAAPFCDLIAGPGTVPLRGRLSSAVLSPERLRKTLRPRQMDQPLVTAKVEPRAKGDNDTILPLSPLEQSFRHWDLECLMVVAYWLAIDPLSLPDVLVNHIGIPDPVDLSDAMRTITRSRLVRSR